MARASIDSILALVIESIEDNLVYLGIHPTGSTVISDISDSMDWMLVVHDIEDRLDISIPDSSINKNMTIMQFSELIQTALCK
jgi:acyl carrier protein